MASRRTSCALLAVFSCLVLVSGCTHAKLVDDVDLVLDWTPLTGPGNALNSPYVEGSAMRIYVSSSNNNEHYAGWHVESSAPEVFSVDSLEIENSSSNGNNKETAFCRAHAKSPGTAELRVLDENGQYVGGDFVEVRRPDELRLLSHGMLLVGYSEDEARVAELRILAGGTATYLARYYFHGAELHGNGALSAPSTAPISAPVGGSATVAKSFIFEDRDWLQLTPQDAGNGQVNLLLNGTPFVGFPVVSVPPTDVTSIRILNSDESQAKTGDWLVSYAQAVDNMQRPVLGVEYVWQMDSTKQNGIGDLFRYEYDPRQPKMLTASFGGMSAQTFVHSKKGFVDSTNHIGCSAAPGQQNGDPQREHKDRRPAGVALSDAGAGAVLVVILARAARRRRERSKSA